MSNAKSKLVAIFDIIFNGDEKQVLPVVLKAGHPIDEAKYKAHIDGWKARELVEYQETEKEVEEGKLATTLDGDVGQTDPALLEVGVAPPQLSEDGKKVLQPGLTADGKDPVQVEKDEAAKKTGGK